MELPADAAGYTSESRTVIDDDPVHRHVATSTKLPVEIKVRYSNLWGKEGVRSVREIAEECS